MGITNTTNTYKRYDCVFVVVEYYYCLSL